MAALATQSVRRVGTVPAYVAATGGGDTMDCGDRQFLHVKNGGGGSINVTIAAQRVPATDMTMTSLVVAVGAGAEKMIGPITAAEFQDSTGKAQITYSGVVTVTVGAFSLSI
jgi:hypothetical protein